MLRVLALATLVGGLALSPSPHAAPVAAEPGWITGVVVDAEGEPLPGRLVNVLDTKAVPEVGLLPDVTDRRAYTDGQGRFRVRQSPGGYLVQVCHPEADRPTCKETVRGVDHVITYVGGSGVTDSWVTQRSLLPASTTDVDVGEVAVKPQARVHGTISGAAGRPVRIMRLNDTVAFTVWADVKGRYDIDGMVPGDYYLAAGGEGTLPWRSADLELTAGRPLVVDGALRRGVVLAGAVTIGGRPAAGTELKVTRNGTPVAATVTDERGRYRLSGLRPGRYRVSPYAGASVDPRASTTVLVETTTGTVRSELKVRRGAAISVQVAGQREPGRAIGELRDRRGVAVLGASNDGGGLLTWSGLAPGRYSFAVGGDRGYAVRRVRVPAGRTVRLGPIVPTRPYLTLRGRTEPRAVVEATTGDLCPAGEDERYGSVHEIVRADQQGRYVIANLMPGRYMVGADHWPGDRAPRCLSGVLVTDDRRLDLPLAEGAEVVGRLVYADTGAPVITSLSYELRFAPGSWRNPTAEHPARAKTLGATGRFHIEGARAGTAIGDLAAEGGDEVIHPSFFVIHPTQDGTPYWLETSQRGVDLVAGETTDLGDVEVDPQGL